MDKRGEDAGFSAAHLGMNLERVLRASTRPVFAASREFPAVTSFLLVYHSGQSRTKVLDLLAAQPVLLGLHSHLLRSGKIDANAEWFAQEAAAKLRASGDDVSIDLTASEPEKIMADSVARHGIGLVLRNAYGHSSIRQLVVGRTTTAILRTCHSPVLMLHSLHARPNLAGQNDPCDSIILDVFDRCDKETDIGTGVNRPIVDPDDYPVTVDVNIVVGMAAWHLHFVARGTAIGGFDQLGPEVLGNNRGHGVVSDSR